MRDEVEVRLLGPVDVLVSGTPAALGGPRQAAVVALLALRAGHAVAADRLVDDLWAGEPPGGAATTLRSYVSRLRAALGDAAAIQGSRDGYTLRLDPTAVDVRRFEAALAAAHSAADRRSWRAAERALDEALGLWRGDAFGQLADLPALRSEADRLADLRLQAIELRAEVRLARGHAAPLVDELESLVAQHPYRERLWRLLMLALYHAERQADALGAYRRARMALDEELGIEPGPELQALEAAILRHEVPPIARAGARDNLPAPLTSFVGRAAELAEIGQLLATARLVTISGVGGAGKTRLGIEAARRAAGDFPDGVVFVDLAPIVDPAIAIGQIARLLDVHEQPGAAMLDLVAAHLRDRSLLLVLDNCEHLRDACAEIAERLLGAAPELHLLATSREVLGLPGEATYAVPPLDLAAETTDAAGQRAADAVQLFLARAREARPGIADDDATIRTVVRICADLDGLPLAIELAAARARALSPADIAERLSDRFQFLVSWRRLTPARHRTLREAIDWSYELLDEESRRLFATLSVFAGGWTLAAAAAVGTTGAEALALRLLERLAEASMVIIDDRGDSVRYRLLETIREYASERLAASGDADDARRRHAEHFTEFAEIAGERLRDYVDPRVWGDRITADLENVRAALAWSRAIGDDDRILRITEWMWWYWWMRGQVSEARSWMEMALSRATTSPPERRAQVQLGLAGLAWASADHEAAERHATAARELFQRLGDRFSEGRALNTLGLTAHLRGDNESARSRFEAAIEAFRDCDTEPVRVMRNIATTIDNLGSVAHELGDDDRAIDLYLEARALNLTYGEYTFMNDLHLAHIYAERGRLDEARELIVAALRWYAEHEFVQYVAECLESASIVANRAGDPKMAAFLLGASGAMRGEAGTPPVPFLARLRQRELDAARHAIGDRDADTAFASGLRTARGDAISRTLDFLGSESGT